MSKLIASLFASLVFGGCWDQNANYCANAPHHNCQDLIDAAVPLCTSDQQCAPNVCDLVGTHTCVQCTTANPAACVSTSPVCGADNTCRACTAHSECSSNACLPDGSCAATDAVAYVAAGKSGTCDIADPCGTLAAAIQTGRPYVKFAAGTVKDTKATTIDSKTVTILADAGAALDRDGDGPILVIQSSSATTPTAVEIFDLEITGATGTPTSANAIQLTPTVGSPSLNLTHVTIDNNQGMGVQASGGMLTVSRSVFALNNGGAIQETNGVFVIVGNKFYGNGSINSTTGGITILTAANPTNRLDFNTFALNTTQAGTGPGIDCRAGAFVARNNILSNNLTSLPQPDQFSGTCMHAFSILNPGTVPSGNSGSDPLFVDAAKGDLHLQTTSPARGTADPNSDLTGIAAHDIDGTARTAPATIGAYQLKAQGAQ